MKMKEVCRRTGLTEKAVRLYIKQGLVEPQVEEGLHANAYTFREEDVARLQDVAALREAGFSMADIRQIQQDPDQIPALLEEKQSLLAAELRQKQTVQTALERMEAGGKSKKRSATFLCGGLRSSWQEGEELEIAWDSAEPGTICPLKAPWLRRKALAYLALGLVLAAALSEGFAALLAM